MVDAVLEIDVGMGRGHATVDVPVTKCASERGFGGGV
jgi:hypothetical protein